MPPIVYSVHSACQEHCAAPVVDEFIKSAHHALMPEKSDFIRAWREFRRRNGEPHLTLEGVQEAFGMTHQNVGRIERGEVPYSPDFLDVASRLYRCTKADLLENDPNDPAVQTLDMLRQLTPEQLKMLQAQIRGLLFRA
jgi:transcriptional regulator with XRE-family HTH domain